ncbi:hypothetical protein BGZ97_010995 [Linnemannia gamsii]|uniref:RNI-like protein n=1 Tax=Linnemannia gamsii TaxID=64522 RepID=A0A9P6UNM5_9FUNG|nr:hypothetical protein BGZ97_010995 [Linnemannia gamsii]
MQDIHPEPAMELTQSFRLTGTTEIVRIPIQHVDGQNVVYWESIEKFFPGVKFVKNGDVAVPPCIKYFPGVVLDIVVNSAHEHLQVDSSMGAPNLAPTVALTPAPSVGRTDVLAGRASALTSENKFIEDLRVTSALAEIPIGDIGTRIPLTDLLVISPSLPSLVKTASKTTLSFRQAVKLASRLANESDGRVQHQELTAKMDYMIKSHEEMRHWRQAFDAKQDEMTQLQKTSDAKQEKMNQLQKQLLEHQMEMVVKQREMEQLTLAHQEEMKQMHQRVLGQLSVLQSRVQAVLTQTYELHEYPIPRLFIVLPQYPSGWDILEPFTDKYRLYFLCECGEHTNAAGSNSKIPHEIHLAKHEGYEIARPTEFFQQYGPYVLTMLKMLKFSVSVASVAVPAVAHLINADAIDQAGKGLKHLKDCIEPGVDQVIKPVENFAGQMENKEALEGADLRKLETFLKHKDGNKVLGNLYRTVTDQGHVKWVCVDHYRENYNNTAAEAFRRAVDSVEGSFDENSGVAEVELRSRVLAQQFYAALEQARSVHELKVKLSWETTYGDFKKLRDTLGRTSVRVLEFGYTGTGPASDYINRNQRYDPIRQIMGHPSIQSFTMASIHDDFLKRSNFSAADTDFSNLKRLVIGGFESDASIEKFKLVLSRAPNITSLSLVTPKRLFEGSSPWSRHASIVSDVTYIIISRLERGDKISIELDMEMKPSNDTRLLLGAPSDVLEKCNLWPADAKFSNLKRLVIKQFDMNTAGVKFYMAHAPALTTLDVADNSIDENDARALAKVLKINSTLTTLNLRGNSIGSNGGQALAEALKSNSTLTTLDLAYNSIGSNGAYNIITVSP